MWIVPKSVRILASVQDTEALILDSQELSDQLEQSVLWRSKPSPSQTWRRRLKTTSWMRHLSGATLKLSHGKSFAEKWTSSVEGFLVSHSQELENEKQMTTQDICGRTSSKESKSLENLPLFSSKMLKESCQANSNPTIGQTLKAQMFCTMSSENWKDWVTEQRQEYSQRAKSVHHTKESEFSFLAYTPNSTHLEDLVFQSCSLKNGAMWRTPIMGDVNGSTYSDIENVKALMTKGRQDLLTYQAQLEQAKLGQTLEDVSSSIGNRQEQSEKTWATPTARDWKGAEGRAYKGQTADLPAQTEGTKAEMKVGNLNPRWVETVMGLPIGWTLPSCSQPWIVEQTNYDLSEMGSYPKPQKELSVACGQNWSTPRASQRGDTLRFFLTRCLEQVKQGKQTFSPMLQVQTEAAERGLNINYILDTYKDSEDIEDYIDSFLK